MLLGAIKEIHKGEQLVGGVPDMGNIIDDLVDAEEESEEERKRRMKKGKADRKQKK